MATIHSASFRLEKFVWELHLHPEEEFQPYAHVYLSTNVSQHVYTLELKGQARGEYALAPRLIGDAMSSPTAATTVLEFPLVTPCANEEELDTLLAGCSLNVDFFVHCRNSYKEVVTNPAGGSILSLPLLLDADDTTPLTPHDLVFHQVHDPRLRVKGRYQIRIERDDGAARGSERPISAEQYLARRPRRETEREQQDQWRSKAQLIAAAYIEAVERYNERIESTIESVSNINSSIWVHRAGISPPLAYAGDTVPPPLSDAYLQRLVEIVLRRMRMTAAQALALSDSSSEMGLLAGQVLCVLITHTIYRSDFVFVYNQATGEVEKKEVENFGDVSVDQGCGYEVQLFD